MKKKEIKSDLPRIFTILPQVTTQCGEKALFALVGAVRPEYYVCHNKTCPLCYKNLPTNLIKKPLGGVGIGPASKRLDIGGMQTTMARAAYKAMGYETYDKKKHHARARYGTCPVCGYPLSKEPVPGISFKEGRRSQ